jgi:hypothetical protein
MVERSDGHVTECGVNVFVSRFYARRLQPEARCVTTGIVSSV